VQQIVASLHGMVSAFAIATALVDSAVSFVSLPALHRHEF